MIVNCYLPVKITAHCKTPAMFLYQTKDALRRKVSILIGLMFGFNLTTLLLKSSNLVDKMPVGHYKTTSLHRENADDICLPS